MGGLPGRAAVHRLGLSRVTHPKISVVIAAYRPGAGFRRVVDSLAAQSLPQEEFEVIVVDDGSPDDTFEMLEQVSRDRPNYRVERIENSGWPSRPRNVGIELASGEYVLFMDHDDSIFPDGLRAAYEYAKANDADVVSAKELKTSDPRFGLTNFTKDIPNARAKGVNCLLPMMPHKLYRRQMLLDHGIRFPEGRKSLWEDVAFNVAAYRYATVVSVLSSTPVYLWHHTGANSSSTYGPWEEHFWDSLDRLYEFIDATFDSPEFAADKRSQFLHHYRIRTVERIRGMLLKRDRTAAEERFAMERGRQNLERFVPVDWDRHLSHTDRVYGHLIRAGQLDILRQVVRFDAGFKGLSTLLEYDADGPTFQFTTEARWATKAGTPLPLRRDGDRILRVYPGSLGDHIPAEIAELSGSALKPTSMLTLRHGATSTSWKVPSSTQLRYEAIDPAHTDIVTPVVAESGTVDPSTLVMGGALADGLWQLRAQNTFCGMRTDATIGHAPAILVATHDGTTSYTTTAPDSATATERLFPWCEITVALSSLESMIPHGAVAQGTARLRVAGGRAPWARLTTAILQRLLDLRPGRVTTTTTPDGRRVLEVHIRAVRGIRATMKVDVPGVWNGDLNLTVPRRRGSVPTLT